jgi:ABC-2 type transport system permease protein
MYALRKLVVSEFRLFLRDPMVVFFAVGFPAVLITILGNVPSFRAPTPELGGARVVDLFVGVAVLVVLATLALLYTPASLSTYRERGVLRRLSTTPLPPARLLLAQLLNHLLIAVPMVVIVLAIGRIAFDVPLPREVLGYATALVLITVALFSFGLFIAAVVPSGKAGNAVGTAVYFPLMFFGGLWVPREAMPDWLRAVGDLTPLGAGAHAMRDAATGDWPQPLHLAVVAAYGVAFGVAAAKLFRWE